VDGNPVDSTTVNGYAALTIGYLGISDAQKAVTNGNGGTVAGGDAVPLEYNGVYESDVAVENGSYPYWGSEHLLGQVIEHTDNTLPAQVGAKLDSAIITYIGTKGSASGNISTAAASQSLLVPWSKMNVVRGSKTTPNDSGFPTSTE
jgi:hypothetical protein